jgi:hypothetical protein
VTLIIKSNLGMIINILLIKGKKAKKKMNSKYTEEKEAEAN